MDSASPNASSDLESRSLGGRFELLHTIGQGACASVWLVRNQETGAFFAAKLVEVASGQDELRFQREVELSARLTHRNLVRVFDYVREDHGRAALVMEHLRGETLEDVLRRVGPLPVSAAVAVIVAVLRGVEHAHAQGIVHRDLKPSNLFLAVESDGLVIPKVLDFGIAKETESTRAILLTQQGHVLGTPAYMSPEQVRGEQVGPASDLFSLGVVLYEALTGQLVFRAPSAHAAMLAILEREAAPHPAIPADLWAVLARALAKSPEQRFADAAEMRAALEACVEYTECDPEHELQALHLQVAPLPEPATKPRISAPSYPPVELAETELALRITSAPPLVIPGLSQPPRAALWGVAAAAMVSVLLGGSLLGRGTTIAAATARTSITRMAPVPVVSETIPPPEPSVVVKPRIGKSAAQKTLAAKLGPPPPSEARPTPTSGAKPKTKLHH